MTEEEKAIVFIVKIDSVKKHAIRFELFVGEKGKDTYVNTLVKCKFLLTPKQFTDFVQRLVAHTYLDIKTRLSDEELKILWGLKLNIFDGEAQQTSKSIFAKERERVAVLIKKAKRREK